MNQVSFPEITMPSMEDMLDDDVSSSGSENSSDDSSDDDDDSSMVSSEDVSDDDDDESSGSEEEEEEELDDDDDEFLDIVSQEMNLKNMHQILQLPSANRPGNSRSSSGRSTPTNTGNNGKKAHKAATLSSSNHSKHQHQHVYQNKDMQVETPTLRYTMIKTLNARLLNLAESGTYVQTNAHVTANDKQAAAAAAVGGQLVTPSGSSASLQAGLHSIQSPTLNKNGTQHPQATFEQMVGVGTHNNNKTYDWDSYFLPVTKNRISAYSLRVTQAVRSTKLDLLERMQEAYIRAAARSGQSHPSPLWNACNAHGESIMHVVARRSQLPLLQFVLNHGGSLHVRDDYHKTPLHDACWTREPNFDCIALLLQKSPELLLTRDKRNFTPLQYIPAACYPAWNEFLAKPEIQTLLQERLGGGATAALAKASASSSSSSAVEKEDVPVKGNDLIQSCMDSMIESQIALAM